MWLQYDDAPPHFARDVNLYLNEQLGYHWIGRCGINEWPARSPDLTPVDLFLC
ncbi:hypothetical protein BDFB_005946 [Asbolus verrucosus]|uniref:DDE 3 domain containing protein n=1 Tax=Asbolus verrucosus TaxID=1661398 RepID=A0A482VRG4_ASBVE|nr:hypothetical protein BDFB_005946 [Asbolus verrucosus]